MNKRIFSKWIYFMLLFGAMSCVSDTKAPNWISNVEDYQFFSYEYEVLNSSEFNNSEKELYHYVVNELLKNFSTTEEAFANQKARELIQDLVALSFYQYNQVLKNLEVYESDDFVLTQKITEANSNGVKYNVQFAVRKEFSQELYRKFEYLERENGLRAWSTFQEAFQVNFEMAQFASKNLSVQSVALFEKYIKRLDSLINSIRFELIARPAELILGTPIQGQLVVRLRSRQFRDMSSIPLVAMWRDKEPGLDYRWYNQKGETDSLGKASFGNVTVMTKEGARVSIEFSQEFLRVFANIKDEKAKAVLVSLQKSLHSHNLTIQIPIRAPKIQEKPKDEVVLSNLSKKTAVLLVQFDSAGRVTEDKNTAQFLVDSLGEEAKEWLLLEFSADNIGNVKKDFILTEEYKAKVLQTVPKEYDQVVLGHISLSKYEVEGEFHKVLTEGVLHVLDLEGKIVYQTQKEASSRGQNFETVMDLSWRSLGKILANDLKENL